MPDHPCGTAAGIGLPANMSAEIIPTEADLAAASIAFRLAAMPGDVLPVVEEFAVRRIALALATERARVIAAAVRVCEAEGLRHFAATMGANGESRAAYLCAAAIRGLEKP